MPPKGKTVADAISLIEGLSVEFKTHVAAQGAINADQASTNKNVQSQIFETRLEVQGTKTDVALVSRGVEEIKDLLRDKKMSWQFWVGIGVAAAPGIWGIASEIFKSVKG